jgi:hypothetical protein
MLSKIIILVRLQNNRQSMSEINSRKSHPSIKIYLQYNKNYRKYKEKEKRLGS